MINTKNNTVSVHIVNYNNEKYLPHCLKSLANQKFADFSILLIDNNSQDGSVNFIEKYIEDHKNSRTITLIKNSKNIGFATAHNQAIQWSKSKYIFMMNPDTILDKNYIKHIVNFLDKNKHVATGTGASFKWDFESIKKNTKNPHSKTNKVDSFGLKIAKNHKVVELLNADLKKPTEVFGVSGAVPIYRREALEKIKTPLFYQSFKIYVNRTKPKLYEYFDNDFFCYKEDVDIAYRLRLFNYQSFLIPKAKCWHDRTASQEGKIIQNRRTKSDFIKYHSYKNHIYFLIKNLPTKLAIKNIFQILGYELAKFTYILILERKTLKSYREIAKNLSKMIKKRLYIQKKAGPKAWKNIEKWLCA